MGELKLTGSVGQFDERCDASEEFDNLSDFGLRTTLAARTPPGRERSNGSAGRVCCGSVRSLANSAKELPHDEQQVAEAGAVGAQSTEAC